MVLALGHELRCAGERPAFGGWDEAHHALRLLTPPPPGRVLGRRKDERAPRRPVLQQIVHTANSVEINDDRLAILEAANRALIFDLGALKSS